MADVARVTSYNRFNNERISKSKLIRNCLDQLNLDYKKNGELYIVENNFFIRGDIPEKTSIASYYATSGNKWITVKFLEKAKVNVPESIKCHADSYDYALNWACEREFDIAIKTNDGDLGNDVYLNVGYREKFDLIWNDLSSKGKVIIMEEMLKGKDYRLLVVGGRFCAATTRTSFNITGNGILPVNELINNKNKQRASHPYSSVRKKLLVDDEIISVLKSKGLALDSILKNGETLFLRDIPNIAKGGEHTDITNSVHSGFRSVVEKAFSVFPPSGYLGFDIVAEDITKSPDNQKWGVIEVDAHACLMHHHLPVNGEPRDVISLMILDSLKFNKLNDVKFKCSEYADIYNERFDFFDIGYAVHKQLLKKAAWKRNLNIEVISNRLWSIDDGDKKHFFVDNMPDITSQITRWITNDKDSTRKLLESNGFKTPEGRVFKKEDVDEAWKYAVNLKLPAVIKPVSGSGGKGVVVNISDKETFIDAVFKNNLNSFIVEKHIFGNDYRLLVIQGSFVAASVRTPANVIGNGVNTLDELIAIKNEKRSDNPHLGKSSITISPFCRKELEENGINENSVIPQSQQVFLQKVANVGAGGDSEDLTPLVHEAFQQIVSDAWRIFPSLHYCGFDILAEDISKNPNEQEWGIIEVNANADVGFHHFPSKGDKRDVAASIVDSLFPDAYARANNMDQKCVELIIEGNLKNVGYRKWLRKQAFLRGITGWNETLDDNRVRAVLIGMPNAVNNMIDACYSGTKRSVVKNISINQFDEDVSKSFCMLPSS